MTLSICIFAHNEERLLPCCVGALDGAADGADFEAHILVNGSSDGTAAIAKTLVSADPRLTAHERNVADKANAWNDYVHRIANPSHTHIFLDGDIEPSQGAFSALDQALKAAPDAYAAAALPATGRSRRRWARRLLEDQHLSGNLYALSAQGLRKFREKEIFLPFGAKGEDGIIAYLVLTDLRGGADDSHTRRLIVAHNASFEFDSLKPNRRDFTTYRRRLQRYAERHFQKQILYRILKRDGVGAMPDNIYDIYTNENLLRLRPRLDPLNYWFDREALQKLRNGEHLHTMTRRDDRL